MKVAGSSSEAVLGASAGPDDILTGTSYIDERDHPGLNYISQNNFYDVILSGSEAQQFILVRVQSPQGPDDEALPILLACS